MKEMQDMTATRYATIEEPENFAADERIVFALPDEDKVGALDLVFAFFDRDLALHFRRPFGWPDARI